MQELGRGINPDDLHEVKRCNVHRKKNLKQTTKFMSSSMSCEISSVSLLKWEHCDTLAKQLGFIFGNVGSSCGNVVLKGVILISNPAIGVIRWSGSRLCLLAAKIGSSCKYIMTSRVVVKFTLGVHASVEYLASLISQKAALVCICFEKNFQFFGKKVLTVLSPLADLTGRYSRWMMRGMLPLYVHLKKGITCCGRPLLSGVTRIAKITTYCANAALGKLEPFAKGVEKALECCAGGISKLVSPIISHLGHASHDILKATLWDRVLCPVGKFGGQMLHGVFSGALGSNQAEEQRVSRQGSSSSSSSSSEAL
jgi:hypothetical protein